MLNKIGLIFSHLHIANNETHKFDILQTNIEYFREFLSNFFIVVSGHGMPLPERIMNKIDGHYWENTIDQEEIGRGHPKFCLKAYNIMIDNNIEKTLKLRASDFIGNKQVFCDMLQQEKLVITEQTSMQRRMLGDLLMFGSTKQALDLWGAQPWDYSKSGLYNLFDNAEILATSNNMTTQEYLQKNSTYVTPERIKWYTYENNWDLMRKKPKEEFSTKHLWGNIPGYPYYGGY